MNKISFASLGVSKDLVDVLNEKGIVSPSSIQEKAIPAFLTGKNVMAKAPTGTGKTAAFAIPLVLFLKKQKKHFKKPSVLVLSPTRELSEQIQNTFDYLTVNTDLKSTLIIGGVKETKQINSLKTGIDIVVATPGRLCDLIQQEKFDCSTIKYFILDEGDMMLDMGFLPSIKFIYSKLSPKTQMGLFSATIPNNIRDLAVDMMQQYEYVEAEGHTDVHKNIEQKLYYVDNNTKKNLLAKIVNEYVGKSIMVFCNKKRCADFVAFFLSRAGFRARSIHGDKPQYLRKKIISDFKSGESNVLVATDVAARGIHIDNVGLVINYDVPTNVDTYVHRMGRTGRANQVGECISFVTLTDNENMNSILERMNDKIEIVKFNRNEIKGTIENSEILRSHPSYGVQARKMSNQMSKDNSRLNKKTKQIFKSSSIASNFMREKAVGKTTKSKLRNAERELVKKDDDWQNNM